VKNVEQPAVEELRPGYRRSDFDTLIRGKCVERLRERSNIVVIDPRVAEFFPNPEAVNAALRSLAEIAQRSQRPGPPQAPRRLTRRTRFDCAMIGRRR